MDLRSAWNHVKANLAKKIFKLDDSSEDLRVFVELLTEYHCLKRAASDDEKRARMIELIKRAEQLNKRVDHFEDEQLRINIPHFGEDDQSFKNYLESLREFMKIWKTCGESRREKGEKSFVERLQQLDQPQHKERKSCMKKLMTDLGTDISKLITHFLLLVVILGDRKHIVTNLDDLKAMLKLLSVDNKSLAIETFLSVIHLVERTVKKKRLQLMVENAENDYYVPVISNTIELELLQMILKEVLRLEVALCCPGFPMALADERYLSMESYLRNIFQTSLAAVNLKMNELRVELVVLVSPPNHEEEKARNFAEETMAVGVQNIWNQPDLYLC